jgi:hypothetical protein
MFSATAKVAALLPHLESGESQLHRPFSLLCLPCWAECGAVGG